VLLLFLCNYFILLSILWMFLQLLSKHPFL
jgi:hypothetical protein